MSFHLLVGIAALLSAVEESTAATSVTILDCGGMKFQHELYTHSEFPAAIEDTDFTFLVPWMDAGQVRKMELNDFENGAYVRTSHDSTDMTQIMLGSVFSNGNSQVYVPSEKENPGGFSRLFFENYLLKTARRYRFVVLSFPEDSHMNMSNDSLNSLIRFMSLPSKSLEINLVAVGEENETTRTFFDTDHHSNFIRNTIKSCRECSLVTVKRWVVTEEEAGKNFPSIPYDTSEFRDLFQAFQPGNSHQVQNFRTLTCLKITQSGESMVSPHRDNQFSFTPMTPGVPEEGIARKAHDPAKVFAELLVHQLLPIDHYGGSSLLRMMDELAPLEKTKNADSPKNGELPMILYEPVETCKHGLLVIRGDYFILEINGKGCDYKTVLVRASVGVQIKGNIVLPGKSLIIYAPEVSSFGDFVIDLAGKECAPHYSGNFIMLARKFHGLPLKVITNGGKDCGTDIEGEKRDVNIIWHIDENGEVSFGSTWENHSDGMGFATSGRNNLPKKGTAKSHFRQSKAAMGKLKNAGFERGFTSSLNRRDLIQIFAGHIVNDDSMDGKKIFKLATILNNLVSPTGGGGVPRRIFDQIEEHTPFNPPPFVESIDLGKPPSFLGPVGFGKPPLFFDPIDFEDVPPRPHRNFDNPEDECLAVKFDDYEIDCAIDFSNTRENEKSLDLASRLKHLSVAVEKCHQVNLPYFTEYDLFFCNLTLLEVVNERNSIQMDDGLTCYYDQLFGRQALCCRFPNNVIDGDSMTSHVVDIARAVLSIRHMAYNPLDMTRISLTKFDQTTSNRKLFSDMINGFNEAHKFISRDLDNYYEESLIWKSMSLINEFRTALRGDNPFLMDTEVGDMICWTGFILSKILGPPPMSNLYPLLFEELLSGTANPFYFDFIGKQIINEIFLNFKAFSAYLDYLKIKTEDYSAEVKEPLSEILERYIVYARNVTTGNNFTNSWVIFDDHDEQKIKFSKELESAMNQFVKEVIGIEETLEGEILDFFRRTVGNFVRQQKAILSVFRTTSSIVVSETALEFLLRYPFEFLYKIGSECKTFNFGITMKKFFFKAKMIPSFFPNDLYTAVLENLDLQRKVLEELSPLTNFTGEMKVHLETSLYLEREVFKSLQSVARANDIKKNIEKVENFKGEREFFKPGLQNMYDLMDWSLADLIFKSALIDFQQRIFPYWDDMSDLFHPENVAQSLFELSKSEQFYLNKFKHIPFDPKNESAPGLPFFTWHVNDIGHKPLRNFFRGNPLFLLAKVDGEFPFPLKGFKFFLRFIPKPDFNDDWLRRTRGTEIHVRPASFAYNYCAGETFFTAARSPRSIQTIGFDSRSEADILLSPFTLWRLRVSKIRVDFPENAVEQIQLVGEAYAFDSEPTPPEYPPSWEPKETYEDIFFTLPEFRAGK